MHSKESLISFCFILGDGADLSAHGWESTKRSIEAQEYPTEKISIIRSASSLESGTVSDVVVFIEKPASFDPLTLHRLAELFQDELIAAVQPRVIYSTDDPATTFPVVYGFQLIFRVPVLSGIFTAVRTQALASIGGFDNTCKVSRWWDVSWRLLFFPFVLRATRKITVHLHAPSGNPSVSFYSRWVKGRGMAHFTWRWRKVLLKRSVRFFFRTKLALIYRMEFLSRYFSRHPVYFIRNILEEFIEALSYVVHLPLVVFFSAPLHIAKRKQDPFDFIQSDGKTISLALYPWTFFYEDDHGLYARRILLKDYHYFFDIHGKVARHIILNSSSTSEAKEADINHLLAFDILEKRTAS